MGKMLNKSHSDIARSVGGTSIMSSDCFGEQDNSPNGRKKKRMPLIDLQHVSAEDDSALHSYGNMLISDFRVSEHLKNFQFHHVIAAAIFMISLTTKDVGIPYSDGGQLSLSAL